MKGESQVATCPGKREPCLLGELVSRIDGSDDRGAKIVGLSLEFEPAGVLLVADVPANAVGLFLPWPLGQFQDSDV